MSNLEKLPPRVIDLTGQEFGRWKVIGFAGYTKHRNATWLCRCDCGTEKSVSSGPLRSGKSLSCGCFNEEVCTKHGQCDTKLYQVWHGMVSRCTRKTNKQYEGYGGRGIIVCERWMTFANFLQDMGPHPGKGMQIDREDNDGNYEPGNCRWVTRKVNMRNRRNNRLLTLNGEAKCMSEWAEELGIERDTIRDRLRRGWSEEKALSEPVQTKFRRNQ